jgi:spermidine synthase
MEIPMGLFFTEEYPEAKASFSIEISRILFSEKSQFQHIEILESPFFGKILVIDNCIMLTEKDEFIYHEMIAHVPLHVHPRPSKVLVIGGGDGGTIREVTKHQDVDRVVLVDIDQMVSEVCLKYLPKIASKLLSEKVTCLFQDGVAFVKETDEKFDIIIIDSTDPIGVGKGLFTRDFYIDCHRILADDGFLINQAESPFYTRNWLSQVAQKLDQVFSQIFFYQANIPTYPSGYWLFGFASKEYHPTNHFNRKKYEAQKLSLKYYDQEIHRASFMLPKFVRDIIHAK